MEIYVKRQDIVVVDDKRWWLRCVGGISLVFYIIVIVQIMSNLGLPLAYQFAYL